MKIDLEKRQYIRTSFAAMQNKKDFLSLLNFAKGIIYGEKAIPFEIKNINYYSKVNSKRYRNFVISKKSGGERTIYSPSPGLMAIQRCLNLVFQSIYEVPECATGFVIGKSIVDNAKIHAGNPYVYNIDLKDFFSSIDQARVWGRLKAQPYNLNDNGRLEIANLIAVLCCTEMEVERMDKATGYFVVSKKNVVPQGAPTSPILINIICQKLDFYLEAVARRFGLNYTRYADDITFSSKHNVYQNGGKFLMELHRIIDNQNFTIKESKTRLQKEGYKQEVTGLIVNEKPNVHKNYIKQLRQWLYIWEREGVNVANTFFKNSKRYRKGTLNNEKTNLTDVLRGKLNFLKMVKGETNSTYKGLKDRFDLLTSNSQVAKKQLIIDSEIILAQNQQNVANNASLASEDEEVYFKLPLFHKPKELVAILNKFTLNNSALKYSTHSWDTGQDEQMFIDLPDFLRKVKKEFNPISDKLKSLKPELFSKILSFLLNENVSKSGWGIHRVKVGWSSPELLNYVKADQNRRPENFVLPEDRKILIKKLSGEYQTIQKFSQVIDIFKNEIEIRDENSALKEIILELHDEHLNGFRIVRSENLDNKNFYTDVDYFRKALNLVFECIKKRPEYREVSYFVVDSHDSYTLNILHHDSKAKGKSKDDLKLSLNSGDFGSLKTRLYNLCDWSIESEFIEGSYRINYLTSDKETVGHEKIDLAEGFKYIFKFYK